MSGNSFKLIKIRKTDTVTMWRATPCSNGGVPMTHTKKSPEKIDPTDDTRLRALKNEVVDQLNHLARFEKLQNDPPGLVLSGGGGKGAYEAGVILALYDCGLHNFAVIAGTSVGGLNAALCQYMIRTGDRDAVLRVWSNLNFANVMRPTFGSVLKLALYFPMSALTYLNVTNLIAPLTKSDIELESWKESLCRIVGVPILAMVIVFVGFNSALLLAFAFAPVYRALGSPSSGVTSIAFFFLVFILIPKIAEWLSGWLSIASNTPLRRTIEMINVNNIRKGDPEVICTLASKRTFAWRAAYVPLSRTDSAEEATDILVQTAALPEIFPARFVVGRNCVDGGMADNTPILAVSGVRPRSLVVVYLDHRFNRLLKFYRKHNLGLKDVGGRLVWDRIVALKLREGWRMQKVSRRRDERWDALHADWFRSVDLVPIIPSENLGNTITGTLNFTTNKARKLVALGYEDGLSQLREWCGATSR